MRRREPIIYWRNLWKFLLFIAVLFALRLGAHDAHVMALRAVPAGLSDSATAGEASDGGVKLRAVIRVVLSARPGWIISLDGHLPLPIKRTMRNWRIISPVQ